MSLKKKILIGVLFIGLLVEILLISVTQILVNRVVSSKYAGKAESLAQTVAYSIDDDEVYELKNKVIDIYVNISKPVLSSEWGSDAFNKYIANYDSITQSSLYTNVRGVLQAYQGMNDVDCVYLIYPDVANNRAVYLVDGAYTNVCPPGCVDELFYNIEKAIVADEIVSAYITDEDVYGWLITAGAPVFHNGQVIAYVFTDISMLSLRYEAIRWLIIFAVIVGMIVVFVAFLQWITVDIGIVKPITQLSNIAKTYCADSEWKIQHSFEHLQLPNKNDEIADLLSSLQKLECDMNFNVKTLLETKDALSETTELAMKDSLTHVGSRTAYAKAVDRLNDELSESKVGFGIVMIDLNCLKNINDKYGHGKGDIVIQNLCKMICDTFKHSPVFRIGGDEFVVIVKNNDFENVEALLNAFDNKVKWNNEHITKPYEKISAAVGYAEFNPYKDADVQSVFKRADDLMYKNKIDMKSELNLGT